MKVHELVSLLETVSPDAEVLVEGCDCDGKADGIASEDDGDTILISRDDSDYYTHTVTPGIKVYRAKRSQARADDVAFVVAQLETQEESK